MYIFMWWFFKSHFINPYAHAKLQLQKSPCEISLHSSFSYFSQSHRHFMCCCLDVFGALLNLISCCCKELFRCGELYFSQIWERAAAVAGYRLYGHIVNERILFCMQFIAVFPLPRSATKYTSDDDFFLLFLLLARFIPKCKAVREIWMDINRDLCLVVAMGSHQGEKDFLLLIFLFLSRFLCVHF